jgi:hypothetical protein
MTINMPRALSDKSLNMGRSSFQRKHILHSKCESPHRLNGYRIGLVRCIRDSVGSTYHTDRTASASENDIDAAILGRLMNVHVPSPF